jgi:CHAT domain
MIRHVPVQRLASGNQADPPAWTLGPISALSGFVIDHAGDAGPPAEVLDALHAAVSVWAADPVHYAEHLGLLADVHYVRFERTRQPAELDSALEVWSHVRLDAPGLNGLVAARLRIFGVQLEMTAALQHGDAAALTASVSGNCRKLRSELPHLRAPILLSDLARNASRWADTVIERDDWVAAADALDLAERAATMLIHTVPFDQRPELVYLFRHVPLDAASALARADRLNEGIVTLEEARQRIVRAWRGFTDLDRLLQTQHPALYEEYIGRQAEWHTARRAHFDLDEPSAIRSAIEHGDAAEQRYVATLERIRKIPGLERFQTRPSIGEIRQTAREGPILYVWTSRHDTGLTLVLPDGTVRGTLIQGLTREYLAKIIKPWTDCLDPSSAAEGRDRQTTLAILGKILETYFTPAMKDLLTRPLEHPAGPDAWAWGPVALIVCGPLSSLPVHAWSPAILDQRSRAPRFVMPLNYAPSARQAQTARRAPRPTGASRKLLSLADPDTGQPNLSPLPCARLEATAIAGRATDSLLLHGAAATRAALITNAPGHEVIHLACHGAVSTSAPGGARLELAGGSLGISDIANLASLDHVALVVLSACRSGQPDPFMPEESLDIGSLLLATGARAVVANMWPVDDLAAALFVSCLFRLWDWGAGFTLPQAVSNARLWLKELTVGRLLALAEEDPAWLPHVRPYTRLVPPGLERFSEPYYWAAFAYSGA